MKFSHLLLAVSRVSIALSIPTPPTADNSLPKIEVFYVADKYEIESSPKYSALLNSDRDDVLFVLKDTNTYLTKYKLTGGDDDEDKPEDLDEVFDSSSWWNPFAPKKHITTNWVEFEQTNITLQTYPGFIPLSTCQSQELGEGGSLTLKYSLSGAAKFGIAKSISQSIAIFTLEFTQSEVLARYRVFSSSDTCSLKAGSVGQIIARPSYVSFYPRERYSRWSKTAMKFLGDEEFDENVQELKLLSKTHAYCATSDYVKLFCNSEIGRPNWDNPLGIEYVSKVRYNATSVLQSVG
ncbi:hypothetical protein CLIB1423_02S07558 [[Candida] railenensis]|uniref:Uncharacterized protein n=1 Tax=[Candida] railenensis TaxID=45579 RepID=A0A9P0VWJ5_9ASCO|nr:hypothetical protein CLIB1423_02S07558 [[Candida] railenensis]